ncbi:MAG TPA: glycosyltransferase family 29 protein [Thiolinea sp.]|nr:glycosyltransferase family 29 protein [Thiolinea sp.]
MNLLRYPLRWLARYRRQRGCYDHRTLGLYDRLWHNRGTPLDLLAWLRFRRDLGYALPLRLRQTLWQTLPALSGKPFWQGCTLWLEGGGDPARLARLLAQRPDHADGQRALLQNPVLLQGLQAGGVMQLTVTQQLLARLVPQQPRWQQALRQALQQASQQQGICVLGNAGGLRGQGLGARIDAHSWVLRFNCFQGGEVTVSDVGVKLQAQVLTGGSESCAVAADWLLLSGPAVLAMRQDWQTVLPLCTERPLLTVPLPVWRSLVRRLKAPPSAGVLVLAWLRQWLGSWQGISAAGFGALLPPDAATAGYHLARSGHRAAARHNWQGEHALLLQWRTQGLVSLHD